MHLGDCLEKLKELEPNSVESIVTDPPYGLKFMGKKWDYAVPSVAIWSEINRVLKPGAHILSFGGTRTYHRLVVNIEDAGLEIRDQIQWIYGSGFPKSHNIKDGEFKGWGTALKPANEPIVVARKPLEGTVAQNVSKWGTGAINVDGGRIGNESRFNPPRGVDGPTNSMNSLGHGPGSHVQGRWPANVIFDEEAAAMLDAQTQHLHGAWSARGKGQAKQTNDGGLFGIGNHEGNGMRFGDSGGASRFFYVAKASKRERNAGLEGMPKKKNDYQRESSVLSKSGNELGKTTPNENFHPTVKPIKLMEYLIKLVTPPNGTVLDPFMGSGSTGVAAKNLGFKFIGIELNEEYFEIAKRRVA